MHTSFFSSSVSSDMTEVKSEKKNKLNLQKHKNLKFIIQWGSEIRSTVGARIPNIRMVHSRLV